MRRGLTWTLIVVGVGLMAFGYLSSAPWGADSVANSDPAFAFAPAFFVLGIIVVFSSALVYEVMPDRRT